MTTSKATGGGRTSRRVAAEVKVDVDMDVDVDVDVLFFLSFLSPPPLYIFSVRSCTMAASGPSP